MHKSEREKYLIALNEAATLLLDNNDNVPYQGFVDIVGKASGASRTYIFLVNNKAGEKVYCSQIAEFCSKEVTPQIDNADLQNIPFSDVAPRWIKELSQKQIIKGKVKDFPQSERDILDPQGILSILIIPILVENNLFGFIGFDNCLNEEEWSITAEEFLKAGAHNLEQEILRRLTQEQLELEIFRFQTTMDALDAAVYVADIESHELLFLNKYGKETWGDRVGEKCYSVLQKGQDSPCSFCTNHLLIDEKGKANPPYVWEFQNTVNGRWYQCRDQAIKWTDGRLVRLEIAIDISKKKEAEVALNKSEEKIKGLFSSMSSGVVFCKAVYDAKNDMVDCIYEDMNSSYEKFVNLKKEDAIGQTVSKLLPNTEKEWFQTFGRVVKSGKPIAFEMYHDQSNKYYKVYAYRPEKDKFAAIFDDITEEQKAKNDLIESENKYKTLSNATFEAVFISEKGICIEQNEMAKKMFGYTDEEAIGKNGLDWIAEEYRDTVLNHMMQGLEDTYQVMAVRKDKSEFPVEIQGRMIIYKNKQVRVTALRDISEQREAESALRESESLLKEAQQIAQIGHWKWDIETGVLEWSDEIFNIFGVDKDSYQVTVENFEKAIHPDDYDYFISEREKAEKKGSNLNIEHRIIKPNGEIRHVFERSNLIKENNKTIRIFGTVQDITEQKIAEKALIESEKRLRGLIEQSMDGIVMTNEEGLITEWNTGMEILTGIPNNDAIGKPVWDVQYLVMLEEMKSEEAYEYGKSLIKELLKKGNSSMSPPMAEQAILNLKGELQILQTVISALKSDKGYRIAAIMRDVTEFKKAQEQIVKLSTAVEQSANTIVITNTEGSIEYVNPKFTEITGYESSEAIGENPRILNSGELPKEYYAEMWKTISSGKMWKGEFHNKAKSGRLFWEQVTITPIKGKDGEIVNYMAIKEDVTERKRALEALRESEENFRLLFEHSPLGIYTTLPDGKILSANKKLLEILGSPSIEATKQINILKFPPLVNNGYTDLFKTCIKKAEIIHKELEYKSKWGKQTFLSFHLVPFIDENGKVEKVYTVTEDISERKKAETALIDSEMRWKFAVEGNKDGLWDWNIKNNEVFFSSQWKNMLGFTEDEISNSLDEWDKRVHPEDKEKAYIDINKHLQGEREYYENEHRVQCKDGTYKWILDRGKVMVYDEEGNPERMIGTHTDITPRKFTEKALEESNEKFKSLVGNIPGVVYRCINDEYWTMKYVSSEIENLTGYAYTDFLDNDVRSYSSIIHEDDIEIVHYIVNEAVNKKELFEIEYRIINKEGDVIWISERGQGAYDKKGKLLYLDGVIFNINEMKKAQLDLKKSEADLREINATKDRFFSIISHDLKSPFSSILGFSQLLLENHVKYENLKREQIISSIYKSADNAYKLLENLLMWSRAQSKGIAFSPEILNITKLFNDNINFLKPQAKAKKICIKHKYKDEIMVNIDMDMMNTILRNLLSNAIKFTPKGGSIELRANQEGDFLNVEIEDNGVGIGMKDIKKLFKIDEEFSTLGTEKESGTGLGLILCKEFIKLHMGKINVISQPGKGSTFSFTIPI